MDLTEDFLEKVFNGENRVVSFDSEELILVDQNDVETGHLNKAACHDGDGILHRAFSLFIFDDDGQLLLQQRSAQKRLWPLYWSNSCCSHPRRGEQIEEAIHRRLEQELGMRSELEFLYKFRYQAPFGDKGSEHELCWVYAGHSADKPRTNSNEIADWRFVSPDDLDRELAEGPNRFTPWIKLEWARIQDEFAGTITTYNGL